VIRSGPGPEAQPTNDRFVEVLATADLCPDCRRKSEQPAVLIRMFSNAITISSESGLVALPAGVSTESTSALSKDALYDRHYKYHGGNKDWTRTFLVGPSAQGPSSSGISTHSSIAELLSEAAKEVEWLNEHGFTLRFAFDSEYCYQMGASAATAK
jgi:hypothetical protein